MTGVVGNPAEIQPNTSRVQVRDYTAWADLHCELYRAGLCAGGAGIHSRKRHNNFYLLQIVKTGLGAEHTQWTRRVERPGRGAVHSPPPNGEVKNGGPISLVSHLSPSRGA
jgi:hypothetical protein